MIADIRDHGRLATCFQTAKPQLVFHAAAHKHVPLMEENPEEAITNEVVGTSNVVDACITVGVERLVMISAEKAVSPTSMMGASKRLAEMIVREGARRSGRADLKRFFMTISEAVPLVLQAGGLSSGGELLWPPPPRLARVPSNRGGARAMDPRMRARAGAEALVPVMEALVTGGAGFISSHLVSLLLESGHEVDVLDDFSSGYGDNLFPAARLIEGDVCDDIGRGGRRL